MGDDNSQQYASFHDQEDPYHETAVPSAPTIASAVPQPEPKRWKLLTTRTLIAVSIVNVVGIILWIVFFFVPQVSRLANPIYAIPLAVCVGAFAVPNLLVWLKKVEQIRKVHWMVAVAVLLTSCAAITTAITFTIVLTLVGSWLIFIGGVLVVAANLGILLLALHNERQNPAFLYVMSRQPKWLADRTAPVMERSGRWIGGNSELAGQGAVEQPPVEPYYTSASAPAAAYTSGTNPQWGSER